MLVYVLDKHGKPLMPCSPGNIWQNSSSKLKTSRFSSVREDKNLQTLCKSCNSLKNNHPWAGPTISHLYDSFPEPIVKDALWEAFQKKNRKP